MTGEHEWGTAPEFVGPRHELRERLLLELFLSVSPGPAVLDAGAGQGSMSTRLERLGFEVTAHGRLGAPRSRCCAAAS